MLLTTRNNYDVSLHMTEDENIDNILVRNNLHCETDNHRTNHLSILIKYSSFVKKEICKINKA